ncbi:hydrolase [Candidatus Latescibacterota bacterium]
MNEGNTEECCPRFNSDPWNEKELAWEGKLFVKDRIRSIFHIPINFGSVMKRNVELIEAANAKSEKMVVLSDENSLWGADVYISATKEVPSARMATISGTFLSKVFEGSYRNMKQWIDEMKKYIASKDKKLKKLYFFYTTCPKCAKKYGKNYVVLLAQI